MYYWDGQRWVSTLSPDRRQRWNGSSWEPVVGPAYALAPFVPARRPRQPITGVVIVAAIKRWTWAYYAILVLVGFTLLGTVYNSSTWSPAER